MTTPSTSGSPHPAAPSAGLHDLSVVFLHASPSAARLAAAVAALFAQHGAGLDLTVLDLGGAITGIPGVRWLREPSLSVGPGLRRLLPDLRPIVAIRSAEADFDPAALGAGLALMAAQPETELVMSRYAVGRVDGTVGFVLDPSQDGVQLPPCAEDSLLVRRSALERAELWAHHPTLLRLMQDAVRAGGAAVLPEAYFRVSADRFALERLSRKGEQHLLHAQGVDYDLGEPWISVLVVASAGSEVFARALGSLCRQNLPLGLYEIIVVDAMGLDWLAGLPLRVPLRVVAAAGSTRGAQLQQAIELATGVFVLTFDDGALAMPDLVERHVRAHREHPDQRLLIVGTQEAPVSEDLRALSAALEALEPARSVEDADAPRIRPAASLLLHNTSFTPEAALLVGGFPAELDAALDADLGWRLAEYEYEVLAAPEARSIRQAPLRLAEVLQRAEQQARAGVQVMARSGAAIDAAGVHELQVSDLDALLAAQAQGEPLVIEAIEALGELKPASFQAFGGSWGDFAADVEARVAQLLRHLLRLAEARGRRAGLRALGVDGVPALLRASPMTLPGRASTAFVLRPLASEAIGWIVPLAHFLVSFGPNDDTTLILFADPAGGGLDANSLRTGVMELTARLKPGPRGGWADVQVLEAGGAPGELIRLLASVEGYALGEGEPDPELERLAARVGCPAQRPEDWARRFTGGVTPMALDTAARYRLLVWPDWTDPAELFAMFEQYGRALANRDDAALLIRYDGASDGDPDEAVAALDRAFAEAMGEGWELEVVIIDQELDEEGQAALVAASSAVGLIGPAESPRSAALAGLGLSCHADGVGVTLHLFDLPPAPFGPLYPATMTAR